MVGTGLQKHVDIGFRYGIFKETIIWSRCGMEFKETPCMNLKKVGRINHLIMVWI